MPGLFDLNGCLREARLSPWGRELPFRLVSAALRKVDCLTAGDDQMIEGADIHRLQGFKSWTGVRNINREAPIKSFSRNRMDRASHFFVGRGNHW
jgi:hypothetical protein